MKPKHAIQAVVGWCKACLPLADSPDHRPSGEAHEADRALRLAIRSTVAGATPRGDAWQRLQQQITQETVPPIVVLGYGRPVVMSPFSPYSSFTRTLLSRFSQLGVALLLLLSVIGDPTALDRLTRPGGRLARVNPVAQVAPPLPPPIRVNRAALLEATDAAAVDQSPLAVEESDPQPTDVYVFTPPAPLGPRLRQAVDPDSFRAPLQTLKVDPR